LALLAGVLLAMRRRGWTVPNGDGFVSDCEVLDGHSPEFSYTWIFEADLAQGDTITMSVGPPATGSSMGVEFFVGGLAWLTQLRSRGR